MIESIIKFLIILAVGLLVVYLVWLLGTSILAAATLPEMAFTIWKIICLLLAILVVLGAARHAGFAPF